MLRWEHDGYFYTAYCGQTGAAFAGAFSLETSIRITLCLAASQAPITAWEFGKAALAALSSSPKMTPAPRVGGLVVASAGHSK